MNEFNFESYESFVEFVQTFLIKNDSASVIVDNDTAEDILEFFANDDVFLIDDSTEEDDEIYLISKFGNTIIVEYPFNDNGEILAIEDNHILVLRSCLTDEEIESLDTENLIIIDDIEDDECDCTDCDGLEDEEIVDELMDEMVEDIIDDLTNLGEDECIGCLLKGYLRQAYEIGRTDGEKSVAIGLKGLLDEIIEE